MNHSNFGDYLHFVDITLQEVNLNSICEDERRVRLDEFDFVRTEMREDLSCLTHRRLEKAMKNLHVY